MALTKRNTLPPPWLAMKKVYKMTTMSSPNYDQGYGLTFNPWFNSLSWPDKNKYYRMFPEPAPWHGWYMNFPFDDSTLWYNHFGMFSWEAAGLLTYCRRWLKLEYQANRKHKLLFFNNNQSSKKELTKACLSQRYQYTFYGHDHEFTSAEHYMMFCKAELFGDYEASEKILKAKGIEEIFQLGRNVQGFKQDIWDKFKYNMVLNNNWLKFEPNPELLSFLLSTGETVLVNACKDDVIWGIGLTASDPDAKDPMKWRGYNLLGFALTQIREHIKWVTENEDKCNWDLVMLKEY